MELSKNIFFNTDKLIENSKVKISYIGKLYQEASEEVFIHYGFGANWDNINDIQMNKTDLGFQAEIQLLEGDSFNFCFKDSNNNWDNNEGENYIFPLEKIQTELLVLEDEPVSLGSAKKLRKSYLWSKKVRLAVYKIITYLPKLISGNYKRKLSNSNG
ncbi:MAG: carbohydrate-binding protein [Clostridia bacterium]|nr:carbohydrate-binding protein [Clostridia bacterium]